MSMNLNFFCKLLFPAIAFALPGAEVFANTDTSVSQVTTAVTIADSTDYHITGSTPFAANGSVEMTRGSHAVVILDHVIPSQAQRLLASNFKINGEKAVRGTNCDIRIHAQGTIIYPYTEKDAPLTVYSEQNYGGTAVSDFGLEDNGGFMNTLTDAKLNNKIRSFKLRRGYMVTFSTRAGGYGYSRCFIAADEDLDMATMPAILDRSITSYSIFKWNDTGKKGLANNTGSGDNSLLNTTWCYSFGNGEDTGLDRECVRHHIKEGWPSIASVGENNYTTSAPTIKTNNEPGNIADDGPATVAEVLANWQQLMATGKRLCSPSSHDGSIQWLRTFMDSIDARGWRCDVLDIHAYWPEGQFGNTSWNGLPWWHNNYHRPIWISEWCWGASWNNNGVFSTGYTDEQAMTANAQAIKRITDNLESWGYVERYAIWNDEKDRSKVILKGSLTEAGKVYAAIQSNVGYNKKYDYVPTIPKSKGAPSNIAVQYNMSSRDAVITWHEPNGEYNASMTIEKQVPGSSQWETVVEVLPVEQEGDYSQTVTDVERGTKFRIKTVYADGTVYTTKRTPEAVPGVLNAGEALTVDGKTLYAGGNILDNGDFAMGTYGWSNGEGKEISLPDFEIIAHGGYDDAPFLQAYGHGGQQSASSILMKVSLEPNTYYYLSGAVNFPNGSAFSSVILGDNLTTPAIYTIPAGETWTKFGGTFNSGDSTQCMLSFRWLSAMAEYSGLSLQRLYESKDQAVADGEAAKTRRAELEQTHPTFATKEAEAAAEQTASVKKVLTSYDLPENATDTTSYVWAKNSIAEPSFAVQDYMWKKVGTYTDGTQQNSTLDGQTCWRALWTGVSASEGKIKTMEVRQDLLKESASKDNTLSHGLYILRVKAAADHACISDQHAYLVVDSDSLVTPVLNWAVADIPSIASADRWQTLSTMPVYVEDGTPAAIGFTSSKEGAVDNNYKPYGDQKGTGDKREGSWYATDFELLHLPVYRMHTDKELWRGLCLPYRLKSSGNLRLFTVAGTNSDKNVVYLTEVDSVSAGVPCVVEVTDTVQMVFEYGDAVSTQKTGENGLRGYFLTSTSSRASKGSLVLTEGRWVIQTSSVRSERAKLNPYMAIISDIDKLPVLDTPTEVSLPIGDSATGIKNISKDASSGKKIYYDLSGRRVSSPAQGVYIQVQNGKAHKVIK